jgi:hypothetical protein
VLATRAFCDLVDEGNVKYSEGDMDGAFADYTRAIELEQHPALAYSNRGLVKLQKKDLDAIVAAARCMWACVDSNAAEELAEEVHKNHIPDFSN